MAHSGREERLEYRVQKVSGVFLWTQKLMVAYFEKDKDKAEKGEGWAPLCVCCVQDRYLGLHCPYGHTAMGKLYL